MTYRFTFGRLLQRPRKAKRIYTRDPSDGFPLRITARGGLKHDVADATERTRRKSPQSLQKPAPLEHHRSKRVLNRRRKRQGLQCKASTMTKL